MINKILGYFNMLIYNPNYLRHGSSYYKHLFNLRTITRFILPPFVVYIFNLLLLNKTFFVPKLAGITWKKEKVNIKDIWYAFKDNKTIEEIESIQNDNYQWGVLLKTVKKYGVVKPIVLTKTHKDSEHFGKFEYTVNDGNHRLMALKYLYGEDFLIPANVLYIDDKKMCCEK